MSATKKKVNVVGIGVKDSPVRMLIQNFNMLVLAFLNCVTGEATPGLAIATTTTKVKTTNAIKYEIDGKGGYSKAGTDNLWTLTGSAFGHASKTQYNKIYFLLDSAGAATVVWGTAADTLASVKLPTHSSFDAKVIVGSAVVQTAAGTTFTPGTTAMNAAGVTVTYTDGFDPALIPLLANNSGTIIGNR